ncbi:hypothetical protein SYNPS1DRAFT_30037 [Syncephalis pseudoplumigaleata]|uniref:B-block binding subunit of TFIIIC domain-containing protein n=1 Tax=Syncephalis pseudoplumigaleata TaxID=1712513 RepID=A0A4P9YWG7_9FUNG|nr:hypothetical protein SYNPS1DRAFT_30037 [Syncephalis pseudoplumigaleata]|eukprot:RKP24195.1 hypothetical protein SYNPS1DRAFT_30037 [Syncephalis pseudoplumigaleata]
MHTGWSLDDLVQHCVKEIAWDGAQGSDKARLWAFARGYINARHAPGTNKDGDEGDPLDARLQDYLWRMLVKQPQITLTTAAALSQTTHKPTAPIKKTASTNNPAALACAEGEERLVADFAYRRQLIAGGNDMSAITDSTWRVLEAIGRRRERGITQVELHQTLNIGAQSVFHIIKRLSSFNLVKKVNLVFQRNSTNLCLHTNYAALNDSYKAQLIMIKQKQQAEQNKRKRKRTTDDEEDDDDDDDDEMAEQLNTFTAALLKGQTQERWQSNLVRQGVTDILATVPDRTMPIRELRQKLLAHAGHSDCIKWFRRTIRYLIHKGHLESLEMPRADGTGVEKVARLLVPFVASTGSVMSSGTGGAQMIGIGPGARVDTAMLDSGDGMAMQHAPDIQIYWCVRKAGIRGITVQELAHQLGHPGHKILQRHLDVLSEAATTNRQILRNTSMAIDADKVARIVRAVEFAGRMRRYRYFVPEAYEQFLKQEGLSPASKQAKAATSSASTTKHTVAVRCMACMCINLACV